MVVKNLPVNAEDTRNSGLILGQEDFPEEGIGNPLQYPEEPGRLQSMRSQRVRKLHTHTHTYISGEERQMAISLSQSPTGVFTV